MRRLVPSSSRAFYIWAVFAVLAIALQLDRNVAKAQGCQWSCPLFCFDGSIYVDGPVDFCQYPDTGCPGGDIAVGSCCWMASPIIVDVSGEGITLTDAAHGVPFRTGSTAPPFLFAWTVPDADEAWLVLDRNGNGRIDDMTELFGTLTPQPAPLPGQQRNGFLALAVYDKLDKGGNEDGRVDDRDQIYSSLRLWRDRNHNGKSEPDELLRLDAAGVGGIDLHYQESKKVDQYGNVFRYRAKVYDYHGSHVGKWSWDVFLKSAKPSSR